MPDSSDRIARADSRSRLSLGNVVTAGSWYSIVIEDDGTIVLTPVAIVPRPRLTRAT